MDICVLLPTLNEAESIRDMVRRVGNACPGCRIVVVDSGSTDGTTDIAKSQGAAIIELREKGKGRAIKKAFEEINADIVILLDSDMSYAPEEIPLLLRMLDGCDVVVGSRFKGKIGKGSMKGLNRFGNEMLTRFANLLYGKPISDVCSGFWAFRNKAYKGMEIDARHFSLEANFFVECSRKNLRICEVPITYGVRLGETKLSVTHGFDIAAYLLQKRLI